MGSYSPQVPAYNTTRYAQPTVQSATPTAWTTANSPITLYTVTGSILCRLRGVVGGTQLTSTAGTGTAAAGVATATTVLLPTTTANGTTNFVANAAWVDSTPAVLAEAEAAATWVLLTGNIILTIATNNMTAGAVNLYLDWVPVSAGATVVSGSP